MPTVSISQRERGGKHALSTLEDAMVELNAHAEIKVSQISPESQVKDQQTYLLAIFRMLSSISSSMPLPNPKSCFSFDQ